jgi:hypothetical protein
LHFISMQRAHTLHQHASMNQLEKINHDDWQKKFLELGGWQDIPFNKI